MPDDKPNGTKDGKNYDLLVKAFWTALTVAGLIFAYNIIRFDQTQRSVVETQRSVVNTLTNHTVDLQVIRQELVEIKNEADAIRRDSDEIKRRAAEIKRDLEKLFESTEGQR